MIPIMLRRNAMISSTPKVVWHKYSCDRTSYFTEPVTGDGTISYQLGYVRFTMSSSYTWSAESGFDNSGTKRTYTTASGSGLNKGHAPELKGNYVVSATYVDQFTGNYISLTEDVYGRTKFEKKRVATCERKYNYNKGATDYGLVKAPEGELPEEKTYAYAGSADESYCVLYVDGAYYYYVKEMES